MIRLTTDQERQLDEALDKLGHDLRTPNVARATSSKELFVEEILRILEVKMEPHVHRDLSRAMPIKSAEDTWHGPL